MFDYWHQSPLSRHVVDLALIRATRGVPRVMGYAANIFESTIDAMADEVNKTGDYSLMNSVMAGLKAGSPSGDELVMDTMGTFLGPNAGTAYKFFWQLFSDKEKGILMDKVRKNISDGKG